MNYICADAYDDASGVTYVCHEALDHDGIIHHGVGMLWLPLSVISWSDDAPRRRANRQAAGDE